MERKICAKYILHVTSFSYSRLNQPAARFCDQFGTHRWSLSREHFEIPLSRRRFKLTFLPDPEAKKCSRRTTCLAHHPCLAVGNADACVCSSDRSSIHTRSPVNLIDFPIDDERNNAEKFLNTLRSQGGREEKKAERPQSVSTDKIRFQERTVRVCRYAHRNV